MKNKKQILWMLQATIILCIFTGCGEKKSTEQATEGDNEQAINQNITSNTTEGEETAEGTIPVITFDNTEHDFDSLEEGDVVSYRYNLKNTGNAPLIIQQARPSCGCTVSSFSKKPISAGGSGFVEVEFDSKDKFNAHNKTITVTSNTQPKTTVLHFTAFVKPKSKSTE